MSFLSRLLSRFAKSISTEVEDRFGRAPEALEPLARFIFPRIHLSRKTLRPKPDAFLPSGSPLQTSVFRTLGLTQPEIWHIGLEIGSLRGRTLRGRADILVGVVLDSGLTIDPDNTPPRHANIVGWPEEKHEQLMLAMELAESATLHLRPDDSAA